MARQVYGDFEMNVSEFELINRIQEKISAQKSGLIVGIGDDCAVVEKDDSSVFLLTSDCLVEDVHFDLKNYSYQDLGKKSLSVNLSDIAAMGGTPLYAVVSLAIPAKISVQDIAKFYDGMKFVADQFSVSIIGGDISKSLNSFFINVAVVGEARKGEYKLRSHAKVGDGVYVSGKIGSAALGLYLTAKENVYTRALKNPNPQVSLGLVLGKLKEVHAMIDVSDGVVQDLTHILEASGVGAEIEFDKIPREIDFEKTCQKHNLPVAQTLLAGGEDYQLLFTADSNFDTAKYNVTCIGKIVQSKTPKVRILESSGREIFLDKVGFDHFKD